MATKKEATKKTTVKAKAPVRSRVEQTVSAPRKSKLATAKKPTRKPARSATHSVAGGKDSEMNMSEMDSSVASPRRILITRKYMYAVIAALVVVAILFIGSRFWVIAWVDNKPITRFELYSLLEKRDEGKTAEELIVQKLLMSEGQKQNATVTDAEINAEITKVEAQQGGAAQLDQILAVNKTSREEFRQLVELQLIKQKLFGNGVNITDDDVTKYLDQNKDQLPPDALKDPNSSEAAKLRDSAREQLKQMKINDNFNKWLETAMASSRVSRNIPAPTPPQQMMAPQQAPDQQQAPANPPQQ